MPRRGAGFGKMKEGTSFGPVATQLGTGPCGRGQVKGDHRPNSFL